MAGYAGTFCCWSEICVCKYRELKLKVAKKKERIIYLKTVTKYLYFPLLSKTHSFVHILCAVYSLGIGNDFRNTGGAPSKECAV